MAKKGDKMRKFKELTEADFRKGKYEHGLFRCELYEDRMSITWSYRVLIRSQSGIVVIAGTGRTLEAALSAINAHRREMYEALTEEEHD
jgi:hypothetical protein